MAHPLNTMPKSTNEYITPLWLLNKLVAFDLDPCAAENMPWKTAEKMLTRSDDGFSAKWQGRVFLNPPYGRFVQKWIKRLSDHGNGVALIFARTETQFFHRYIFEKAQGVLFLEGRIHFCDVAGKKYPANAGAPSCLVAYGENNLEVLKGCRVKGKLIILN